MNHIRFAVLLTTAMLLSGQAQAQAQRYFMREKIGLGASQGAITYTPVYGAWGSCTGGSQTATLESCSGSDGRSYPSSQCGPQTRSQSCQPAATCSLPQQNYWDGPTQGGSYVAHSKSGIGSAADALTHCNQQGAIYGKPGGCLWDAQAKVAYYNEYVTIVQRTNSVLYASPCTVR